MESKLFGMVDEETLRQWFLILFLFGLFVYKEWPEFWKRIRNKVRHDERLDQTDRSLSERLDQIESDVKEIKEKLTRDYNRMNTLEDRQEKEKKNVQNMMQEQSIIMRALLGTLKGLQELGANGPTKESEEEIVQYLNRQAHGGDGQ